MRPVLDLKRATEEVRVTQRAADGGGGRHAASSLSSALIVWRY